MHKFARISLYTTAWAVTRTWAILAGFQHITYPSGQFLFSDVSLYDWWGGNLIHGHFPLNDPMWQYPPFAAFIFGLGYSIARNMVGFVALAVLADFVLLIVIMRAQLKSSKTNDAGVLLWSAAPILMGPIMLGRFDVFPTLLTVLALLAAGPLAFGAYSAIGTMLKVWPGLALIGSPAKQGGRTVAAFAIMFISGSYLSRLWWPDSFAFLSGQKARGLQIESVGALPWILLNARTHNVNMQLQYGAMEIIAAHTSRMNLVITLSGIALLGTLVIWRMKGRLAGISTAHITLTAVLVSMITSRVLSPQYMVWVIGILCVCLITPNSSTTPIALLLCVSSLATQIVYPWQYQSFMSGTFIGIAAQLIRIGCLLAATVVAWRHVSKNLEPKRQGLTQQVEVPVA